MGSGSHSSPLALNVAPGAKTRINQITFPQGLQRRGIRRPPNGLTKRRALPIQTEPFQIILYPIVKLSPYPGTVNILMPKQKHPFRATLRHGVRNPCRQDMPDMQKPCGTWGKAGS